ncbi:WhiB family transcriptional regulator [Nocardioides sp.]|uniref:WhiB family transcriptional regulator n=1 Tax=Nocardioides sp. TaxID=35761 RepID=UPI0019BAEB93|nr:WhiB family transcriptional regulator [Nocardioides sp.]MBC7277290.1 WhiB family transcriptional regulator [Nocardioides sp.]
MEIITLFGEGFSSKTYELTLKHPTPRTDAWACVGEDPELFHPDDLTQLAEAQQVCADCPMRQACLDLGVSRREWGVWGGVLLESGKPREKPRIPGRKPYKRSQEAIARAGRVA